MQRIQKVFLLQNNNNTGVLFCYSWIMMSCEKQRIHKSIVYSNKRWVMKIALWHRIWYPRMLQCHCCSELFGRELLGKLPSTCCTCEAPCLQESAKNIHVWHWCIKVAILIHILINPALQHILITPEFFWQSERRKCYWFHVKKYEMLIWNLQNIWAFDIPMYEACLMEDRIGLANMPSQHRGISCSDLNMGEFLMIMWQLLSQESSDLWCPWTQEAI